MGQLVALTGLTKGGEEYPILVNEAEIRGVHGNRDPSGTWCCVVEVRDGRAHFVKDTLESIRAQLGRGAR